MDIGIYVHHHGAGHRTRARLLASELRHRGCEVTLLGSEVAGEHTVTLARDDTPPIGTDAAAGPLHWVPLRHQGLRRRMAQLSGWLEQARPSVVVVDVSVEVAVLVRLHGIPVVLVAQPGDRTDDAHRLALDLASAVLAPWPDWAHPARGLDRAADRVHPVGGLSRYAGLVRPVDRGPTGPRGVILCGSAGFTEPGVVDQIRAARPDWAWTVLDGRRWVDDVGALLADADVVVSHAGQNAVADLAAVGAPAVIVPQPRPHEEQVSMGQLLDGAGLATVVPGIRDVDWSAQLDRALATADRARSEWRRWQVEGAVGRAAEVVEEVARAHG